MWLQYLDEIFCIWTQGSKNLNKLLNCINAQSCHCNVYKVSIAWEQVVRFKRICSIEEKPNNCFEQLIQFLLKNGYKEDHVDSETEKVKLVKRTVLFQKRDKKVDDSITLVLTYHPVLNQFCEVLLRPHKHVLKSPRLHGPLPSTNKDSILKSKNN